MDSSSWYPGEMDYLNQVINGVTILAREAPPLCPPGHPDRSSSLINLANHAWSRYKQLRWMDDLNEAIVLCWEALSLCPPGHPYRLISLSNLAVCLSSRYNRLGGMDDLNKAIVLDREALSLHPLGHPNRASLLNNLIASLASRYRQLGVMDDLNEAIILDREAISLCPPGHPDRSLSLNNLAALLSLLYDQLGGMDDLNEAIVLNREALSLHPPGHPGRSTSLGNLAPLLSLLYDQLGGVDDLNEAIILAREALSLCPPGHLARFMCLVNLANPVWSRFEQLRGAGGLNEAVVLLWEALSLCPPGHPHRSLSLNNLAVVLSSRYDQLGGVDDLNEVIVLNWEALSLRPPGHPGRSMSLGNLAVRLLSRYMQLGEMDDLNEAIVLNWEALSLCPPGHPYRSMYLNNLATNLSSRYEKLRGMHDLDEAIILDREALSLRPPGHPDRSKSLNNLALCLSSRCKQLVQIGDLAAAADDKQKLFGLYTELEHVTQTVTSTDLLAAKAWINAAEEFYHPTTLLAYEVALHLLAHHLAALPALPHHLDLLKALSSSLAVDAFSACLRSQSPMKAVELLEQGRAVFWTQLTRLRSPLDNVIESGPQGKVLADEFTRLTSLVRIIFNSPGPDQHDRVCGLNLELQKVVSKIRELPGLSRFLSPPLFSDLQGAARDGPVIIMNASKCGCDALVVFADKDPVHIPLPVTKEDVRGLSSNLHTLRIHATQRRMGVTTGFRSFMRKLWDRVVSHIVDVAQEKCPPQSRIWWCPTAEFSLLPLHAAIRYRKGPKRSVWRWQYHQESVSDLFISSYTTTLTALIHARRSDVEPQKNRFIAIGQADAPGFPKLYSIHTELENIQRHVEGVATFTRVEGGDARVSNVTDKLSENEWVHFACHGTSDKKEPFESAFALCDGMFTIQRIIQCNLKNPQFAYLSACHTTVGDEENPDEAIHLASAMQFAGFRSVIGTMWSVSDSLAPKVASTFYKFMLDESDCLDYTRAAWALWKTLRTVDMPIDQRILYIHLGA